LKNASLPVQKFLTAAVYTTLSLLVIGYLFRLMNWDGSRELLWGGFWMHIASYIGYSALLRNKDHRIGYALFILVAVVAINTFKPSINYSQSLLIMVGISAVYLAIHIFIKNYLLSSSPRWISWFAMVGFVVYVVASLFKILHWPGADILLVVGLSSLASALMLLGMTKSAELSK
jgi:hypothetical protein